MLKVICYKSTLNKELSILESESLFDYCKKQNESLDIKGLLHKSNDTFFQIIEGKQQDIESLFSKIKHDNNHKNIIELINQPIADYTFKTFTTSYCKVEDLDILYGLQEYYTYMEANSLPKKEDFLQILYKVFNVDL